MGHVKCVLDNVRSCSVTVERGVCGHVGYVLDNVVICSMLWIVGWTVGDKRGSTEQKQMAPTSGEQRTQAMAPRMEYGRKSYLVQCWYVLGTWTGSNGDGTALAHLPAGKFYVFPRLWKWWGF